MPKQCPECERIYPDFVDFCVADGCRVIRYIPPPDSEETQPLKEDTTTESLERPTGIEIRARLFPKVDGQPGTFGVEFSSDVVLGRFDPDVGVVDVDLSGVPEAASIDPRHARLTIEDEQWYIEDLSSKHGVFINGGERIDEKLPVSDGDEVTLGKAHFVFETELIDHDAPSDDDDDEDVTDKLGGLGSVVPNGE